jgi:ABC-type glycerol-3-phosphate transport system substrate-binding protein
MRSRTVFATMAAVLALAACGGTDDTADIEGLTATAATAVEEGAE